MGNNRILIPNDVHVGNWLKANAENGWIEIYTSKTKPYITGSVTVSANSSYCSTNHGFMPSAAIWWCAYSSGVGVMLSETGFVMDFGYDKDMTVNYLIFK